MIFARGAGVVSSLGSVAIVLRAQTLETRAVLHRMATMPARRMADAADLRILRYM